MQFPLLLVLCSGVLLAVSTLVGRLSGASPTQLGFLVLVGSGLCALFSAPQHLTSLPPTRTLLVALLAGVLNGVGVIFFYRLIGSSGPSTWQLSTVVPATVVTMCVCTMLGAWLVFQEPLNWQRAAGMVLACAAIWLLR